MVTDERSRRRLQEALVDAIGPEPADTLLTYLPPTGWADVATKRDVATLGTQLRGEMTELRSEMSGLRSELRGEMAKLGSDLRAELHHELRVQFFWTVTLLLTLFAVAVSLLVFA